MRYAGIIYDDFAAAPGVCLTFFVQGCPHHCEGCHNPETWDFNGGKTVPADLIDPICEKLNDGGIHRKFCIMGGEPLCEENLFLTNLIVSEVRKRLPKQEIYLWTGYTYNQLINKSNQNLKNILSNIDYLIDGPYIQELATKGIDYRGSINQRCWNCNNTLVDISKSYFNE